MISCWSRQFSVTGALYTCRPALVGFVNGLLEVVALRRLNIFFVADLTRYDHGPSQPDRNIGNLEVQMREIAALAKAAAEKAIGRVITVKFCATPHHLGGASYRPSGELVLNKFRLGVAWLDRGVTEEVIRLLIHEFGHESSSDHLSSEYHEALCRIGARLFAVALRGEIWNRARTSSGGWRVAGDLFAHEHVSLNLCASLPHDSPFRRWPKPQWADG